MNDRMWAHAQTKRNVAPTHDNWATMFSSQQRARSPSEKGVARAHARAGRNHESRRTSARGGLIAQGKKIIVTAGATREPIDPVRFLSNHSSGKMGVALARAAWRRGGDVTLIVGHVDIPLPPEIPTVKTDTVREMSKAVAEKLLATDVLIMAAAPADFRPASEAPQKIKKRRGRTAPKIVLEQTEDILRSTIARRKKKSIIVGFALETTDGLGTPRRSSNRKSSTSSS